jgi:outer membrane protein assembly factor BamB
VTAYNPRSGRRWWRFRTSGAVKGSVAVKDGKVFFGDYSGTMYAVRTTTGRLVWRTHTAGLSSGFRSGQFYSTPAVRYDRVYIGNTDGKVYSFSEANGEIAWTHTFGDWVYASPAVSDGRVFTAAIDGNYAALSARTGAVLWHGRLGSRTMSSPTVIGPLVYIAESVHRAGPGRLHAFAVRTGRQVWRFGDGKYSSVISGAGMLVVAGWSHLYGLTPRRR